MKKLLFIMALMAAVTAHSQSRYCLNGYSQSEALAMRDGFLKTGNAIRIPTTIWFKKDVIEKILDFLKKEIAPNGESPDGIRVYFGTTKDNQNTVLLVSTYAFGTDETVPSGTYHQDYFDHNINDLFGTTGISVDTYGEINNDRGGAKLYQPCGVNCPDDALCNFGNDFHYITRLYGEGMVSTFGASNGTKIETNCEWFDLGLISAMDAEMKEKHPDDYDGLRIYFGRHAHIDYFSADKDAFVIESTVKSPQDSNIHVDSYDCNTAKGYFANLNMNKRTITNRYITPFFNQFLNQHDFDNKIKKLTVADLVKALISNGVENGEICPTHCPGTSL